MVFASSSSSTTLTTMTTTLATTTSASSNSNSQPDFLYRRASGNSIRNSIRSKEDENIPKKPRFDRSSSSSNSSIRCLNSIKSKRSQDEKINEDLLPSTSAISSKCVSVEATKEALCKRMGALFLRHKVEQLADDVEKMQENNRKHCPFQRKCQSSKVSLRPVNDVPRSNSFGSRNSTDNSSTTNTVTTSTEITTLFGSSGEKANLSEIDNSRKTCEWKGFCCKKKRCSKSTSHSSCNKVETPAASSKSNSSTTVTRIIVVDASILIYSLRTVHEWLKLPDCQIIVPSEALSTLDVLKKGEHTLNWAARRATRFLDERFSTLNSTKEDDLESFQHPSLSSEKVVEKSSNLIPGLFPQNSKQMINLMEFTKKDEEEFQNQLGISIEKLKDSPLTSKKVFNCALYFLHKYKESDQIKCSLAISLPPPHLDFDQEIQNSSSFSCNNNSNSLRFAERANGNLILQFSKLSGLTNEFNQNSSNLIVAPTAASWLTVPTTTNS